MKDAPQSERKEQQMAFRHQRYEKTQEEAQAEWVRRALQQSVKGNVLANDNIVLRRVKPDATAGDIAELVLEMLNRGELLVSDEWEAPFREFYARSPYANIAAHERILVDALLAEGLGLDVDNLLYVAGQPQVAARLVKSNAAIAAERANAQAERERVEAEQIRAELLGYLTNGPRKTMLEKAGAHPVVFQKEVRDETQKLANMSHGELVQLVSERREKRRIKGLGAKEYRAEVTISRAAGEQPVAQPKMTKALSSPYETLPATYTTRGGLTVNMDRPGILKVANTDSFAFRELVRRFGADSINDILAGRV